MNNYYTELQAFEMRWAAKMRALRDKYVCEIPNINNAYPLKTQLMLLNGVIAPSIDFLHDRRIVIVSLVVGNFQYNNSVLKETIRMNAKMIVMHQANTFGYKVHLHIEPEYQNAVISMTCSMVLMAAQFSKAIKSVQQAASALNELFRPKGIITIPIPQR
jgi:hypothetical protein